MHSGPALDHLGQRLVADHKVGFTGGRLTCGERGDVAIGPANTDRRNSKQDVVGSGRCRFSDIVLDKAAGREISRD